MDKKASIFSALRQVFDLPRGKVLAADLRDEKISQAFISALEEWAGGEPTAEDIVSYVRHYCPGKGATDALLGLSFSDRFAVCAYAVVEAAYAPWHIALPLAFGRFLDAPSASVKKAEVELAQLEARARKISERGVEYAKKAIAALKKVGLIQPGGEPEKASYLAFGLIVWMRDGEFLSDMPFLDYIEALSAKADGETKAVLAEMAEEIKTINTKIYNAWSDWNDAKVALSEMPKKAKAPAFVELARKAVKYHSEDVSNEQAERELRLWAYGK